MLIQHYQDGERSALDALIQKHQARAYQYAFHLTKDPDVAADVVSDSFLKVYKALDKFKGDSAFSTWLYRIITNTFFDMRKRQSIRHTTSLEAHLHTEEGEVEIQIEDPTQSPLEEAEQKDRERTIGSAVRQLSSYQKAIVLLYHVEMLSYSEIAEVLDLPIGTVKSRLNRARLSLRELLHADREMFAVA